MKTQYPLVEHFREAKLRVLFVITCFITSFLVSYLYSEEMFYVLSRPLVTAYINQDPNLSSANIRFIFTDISEAFLTYLRISLVTASIITAPYMAYQVYAFFRPGLYNYEQSNIKYIYILSIALMISSIYMSYCIILPKACSFFISYESSSTYSLYNVELEAKVWDYVNLAVSIIFYVFVSFQFPIVILTLVGQRLLDRSRRYVCMLSLIVAALISPPDVISQVLLAVPLFLVFEATTLYIKIKDRYKDKT